MNNAECQIQAYAKLNLTLDVTGRRPDGYHTLRSVMAPTTLCDTLYIEEARALTVTADVPLPEDNTVYRAAALFFEAQGGGARIHIEKRIPSEAGLGGGSADAAATLYALAQGTGLLQAAPEATLTRLYALAARVGADVPYCLHALCARTPALCEGIGERLTPLPRVPLWAVLLKGTRGVSTPLLFRALDAAQRAGETIDAPRTDAMLAAMNSIDPQALCASLGNDLTRFALRLCPEIGENIERLRGFGAAGVNMSGSGACVYGLFFEEEAARKALYALRDAPFAFLTRI